MRAVAVGGGGKSKGQNPSCCGFAGAGGGYSEKWFTVSAGNTVNIVVGRQEGNSTVAYTPGGIAITGGGASGCTAGTAAGGDWNSSGGCAGWNMNYCGGGASHYCGSCVYTFATTCCGYCVVYSGVSSKQIDPQHGGDDCCNARYAGGGSAGSFIWSTGGAGQMAWNNMDNYGQGYGATGGGGGGIGYITRCGMRSPICSCVCPAYWSSSSGYPVDSRACFPAAAGGGGGTKWQCVVYCDCQNYSGCCQAGHWKAGHGGWGGYDNDEGRGDCILWGWFQNPSANWGVYHPRYEYYAPGPSPKVYPWHDIHGIRGSGSAGRNLYKDNGYWGDCSWATRHPMSMPPSPRAGEGAGTGAVVYACCSNSSVGYGQANSENIVNWTLLCCLGITNKVCCADKMAQQLFPNIISCAGVLGGAGGTGICHMASKAGKGGGAGVVRNYIMCVCYGGSYNLCNGTGPALAFPPSELDWRLSTAGTGMVILYWKD